MNFILFPSAVVLFIHSPPPAKKPQFEPYFLNLKEFFFLNSIHFFIYFLFFISNLIALHSLPEKAVF